MCSVELLRKYEHLQIEELCRVCLTKKEQMILISECGLVDMLLQCASIQVCQEDGLCLICSYCANEVSHWYNFRQQVIRSFQIGKWLLKQKTEKIEDGIILNQLDQNGIELTKSCDLPHNLQTCQVNKTCDENLGEQATSDVSNVCVKSENTENESINPGKWLEGKECKNITMKNLVVHQDNVVKKKLLVFELSHDISDPDGVKEETSSCVNTNAQERATSNITNENVLNTDSVSCNQCGQLCVSVYDLNKHKRTHKLKKYECSKCGKCFKQSQTLSDHMRRHYDSRNYACEICEKKFYKLFNVTEHMRIHTGERPFKCEYCVKTFTRGLLLRNHIKKAHTGEKRFVCDVCNKSFVDGYQLKIHMRTHTGEKPFPCDKCDKAFAMQGQLKSHIKYKHTLEKNFICNICGKAFTAKHTLDEHLRTHTGEKREAKHVCTTCGKKCITTTQLKIHIKSAHTGERPFPCQMCPKRFVTRTAMESHLRTHTGEKSFVCCDCGKAFGAKSSLKIHERIHSGERPFDCKVCGKTFAQGSTLKTHMKVHR